MVYNSGDIDTGIDGNRLETYSLTNLVQTSDIKHSLNLDRLNIPTGFYDLFIDDSLIEDSSEMIIKTVEDDETGEIELDSSDIPVDEHSDSSNERESISGSGTTTASSDRQPFTVKEDGAVPYRIRLRHRNEAIIRIETEDGTVIAETSNTNSDWEDTTMYLNTSDYSYVPLEGETLYIVYDGSITAGDNAYTDTTSGSNPYVDFDSTELLGTNGGGYWDWRKYEYGVEEWSGYIETSMYDLSSKGFSNPPDEIIAIVDSETPPDTEVTMIIEDSEENSMVINEFNDFIDLNLETNVVKFRIKLESYNLRDMPKVFNWIGGFR